MPKATPEQLFMSVQRGHAAVAELGVVTELLDKRKDELIIKAINAFNSLNHDTRMTERDALLFVASLAENQRLKDDLESAARDGRRAADTLTK